MSEPASGGPVAIVPLKALDRAKGRLAGHLDRAMRRDLASWMFARVIAACRDAAGVGDVLVVAGDEPAADLARSLGAQVLIEPAAGLAAAMAAADRAVAGAPASLVVAADLPLARAGDLELVCRAGSHGPCVVVAPTRDGGTAALLRRPAGVIATAYGRGSAAAHLRAAGARDVRAVCLRVDNLALDVDRVEHLRAAGARDEAVMRWVRGLSADRGAAYPAGGLPGQSFNEEPRACRRAR